MSNKHTGTLHVFMSSYSSLTPKDLTGDDSAKITKGLQFLSNLDYSPFDWTKVGTAEVTIELLSPDQIIGNKVDSLKNELREHKARAYKQEMELEQEINELLAITHVPSEDGKS